MMKGGLLQQVDHLVRQLLPTSLVLLLALLQAVPWRIPQFANVAPMLPMIGVYYWSLYRPDLMVASVAFGTGIVNDIVIGGPIGLSSLVFLTIQGMTASQRRFFHGKSFLVVWAGFALLAAGGVLIQLVCSAVIFNRTPLAGALLVEYMMTICLYPLPSWLFSRLQAVLWRNE